MPASSGVSLGSSNWIIHIQNEKIVHISDSVGAPGLYTWHPLPIDLRPLHNPSALLLSNLSLHPQLPVDHIVSQLCAFVGVTISGGGSVVIPCHAVGLY